MMRNRTGLAQTGIAVCLALLSGCRSAHIDVEVENRTCGPVRLLEVDYPTASFGTDRLEAGRILQYRIQLRGHGQVKVQYTAADGHAWQSNGPAIGETQAGKLEIVLLEDGRVVFQPQLGIINQN